MQYNYVWDNDNLVLYGVIIRERRKQEVGLPLIKLQTFGTGHVVLYFKMIWKTSK